MITASLVLYKSKKDEIAQVLSCVDHSPIDIVYVVDNSPTDESRNLVLNNSMKAEYIFGQGNVGFGEANNIGIKKAIEKGSAFHIILNPDIIFDEYCIKKLTKYMEEHQDVGLIKPALVHVDGSFNASALMLPSPIMTFGRRFLPNKIAEKMDRRYYLLDTDLTKTLEVPNFSGSFLFIRTSVFEKVGYFDSRYFMYFEDFDLVRRIHKCSRIIYYPEVTVIHAHAAEHRTNKKLLLEGLKSGIKYFNKWGWLFDKDRRKWNRMIFD